MSHLEPLFDMQPEHKLEHNRWELRRSIRAPGLIDLGVALFVALRVPAVARSQEESVGGAVEADLRVSPGAWRVGVSSHAVYGRART